MKSKKEQEWIQKLSNKQDQLKFSKVLDCYHHYKKTAIANSTGFLTLTERKMIESGLRYLEIPYQIYYANEECERCIICFGTYQNFVSFYHIPSSSIRHSDVLGSLFGCGFTNSMIGDIFVNETGAYFTNLTKYNAFLENSLEKIGQILITLQKVDKLPKIPKIFQDIYLNVSSTRLDLIVAKLTHLSRNKAVDYLNKFHVLVNDQKVPSNYLLKEKDVLSIQRVGKFIIQEISIMTKGKNKVFLQKYC